MPRPRQVKATTKDEDGDITGLKGGFGKVSTQRAIADIEAGRAQYAVGDSQLHVVNRGGKKHRHATTWTICPTLDVCGRELQQTPQSEIPSVRVCYPAKEQSLL